MPGYTRFTERGQGINVGFTTVNLLTPAGNTPEECEAARRFIEENDDTPADLLEMCGL